TPRQAAFFISAGRLKNAIQIAPAAKARYHTRPHSGIERPRNDQSTFEQLPVPAKILGSACVSGKVLSRNSRSVPQVSRSGGKCCRYEWRIATPPPAAAKSATSPA